MSELNARAEQLTQKRQAEKDAEALRIAATKTAEQRERMRKAKERIEADHRFGVLRPTKPIDRSGSTRLIVYEIAGAILVVAGFVILIGGSSMGTTYGDTHNIGLLNARTNWVIVGSVFTGAGVLTMAVAAVGNVLGYWAVELDRRLGKLDTTKRDQHGR